VKYAENFLKISSKHLIFLHFYGTLAKGERARHGAGQRAGAAAAIKADDEDLSGAPPAAGDEIAADDVPQWPE